jgi:chemotaxis protein methyltransferase CheR
MTATETRKASAPLKMGYGDFVRFSKLVYERFGLSFSQNRQTDFVRGVRQAFAASTCADLNEYYQLLMDPQQGVAGREQLVNALTVGESHFFRNKAQFNALYEHVLPQIIQRRKALRNLRIWSAGCAGGEEPYSIAIMLRELLPDIDDWAITILATDINTQALDRARKGVYGNWAFREKRAKQLRSSYFTTQGSRYQLDDGIRQMVTFKHLNLAENNYPSYETNTMFMDLILCRNVMIYFSESVTKAIIKRFYKALIDGGWLVVGHSEHSLTMFSNFTIQNFPEAIMYQRGAQTPEVQWDWKPTQLTETPETASSEQRAARIARGIGRQRVFQPPRPKPVEQPRKQVTPSVDEEPESDPLERARELIEFGQPDKARTLLLEIIAARPKDADACSLLGQVYANQGDWKKAEQCCHRALQADKLSLEAYYILSLVFQHTGRLEQAIEAMKKVVYIDHNHILGHFGLADLYYNNCEASRALKSLHNAQRLLNQADPESIIPNSGGITVTRLLQTIQRREQEWSATGPLRLPEHLRK